MKQPISKTQKAQKRRFRNLFIFSVAAVLLLTVGMLMALSYILIYFGAVDITSRDYAGWLYVIIFISSSLLLGTGLSILASHFFLNPINRLIEGMSSLSSGDYKTRIDLGKYKDMQLLAEGFNNLAKELETNEMLHYDFINNFSHEFKTPIASINGLITLMKNKKLPESKRMQYLTIIEEEAERLLAMTSNILNLSKVENKSILKDIVRYNVSEQIRNCILLLQKKWDRKNLSLSLDFDEVFIDANDDLMKQVWMNLIDNAIKFAFEETELKISISGKKDFIEVAIDNIGIEIKEEDKKKIFYKFYQVDPSHSKEGNGIGLSIVKHIVDLHKGTISVECQNGHTIFTVRLPNKI